MRLVEFTLVRLGIATRSRLPKCVHTRFGVTPAVQWFAHMIDGSIVSDGCVRRLGPRDLPALLVLHKHVLAGTISARLGPHCNTVYHRTMLARDDGFTAEARVRRFGLDAELYVVRLDAPTAAEVRPR